MDSKYMKETRTTRLREKYTFTIGDFNAILLVTDRTSRQKIKIQKI